MKWPGKQKREDEEQCKRIKAFEKKADTTLEKADKVIQKAVQVEDEAHHHPTKKRSLWPWAPSP